MVMASMVMRSAVAVRVGVVPAKAGTHRAMPSESGRMDSRLRGNDTGRVAAAAAQPPLQNQIPVSVYAPAPSRRNHRRGVELLDDGRAGYRHADVKTIALIDHRF